MKVWTDEVSRFADAGEHDDPLAAMIGGVAAGSLTANTDRDLLRLSLVRAAQEWGVQHPGGKVTVRVDGHAFDSRVSAETERAGCEQDCGSCDGGTHTLVMRDRQQWRAP